MDLRTGEVSVRLATQAGNEIVSGHFRVPPHPGAMYAGFGASGPAGGSEAAGAGTGAAGGGLAGAWGGTSPGPADRAASLHHFTIDEGYERFGPSLAFRGRAVYLRLTREESADALGPSPVVHSGTALTAEIFGAPSRVAGSYALYAYLPSGAAAAATAAEAAGAAATSGSAHLLEGSRLELWHGKPAGDVEPVRIPIPPLPAGEYELVLEYAEPDYRLELVRVDMNVIAAAVEVYVRQSEEPDRGERHHPTNGAQPAPGAEATQASQAGEIVLRSDRDVRDLYIEVTARPLRAEPGAGGGEAPNQARHGAVLLWRGAADLEAGKTTLIPVQWDLPLPFEYVVSYRYPEHIILAQAGRRVPPDHPFLLVRQDQYAELRERASRPPWSEMAREAEAVASRRAYNASADIRTRSLALREIIDAATLLYILDPAGRQRHLATLNWAFDHLPDLGNDRVPDPSVWDANVPVANALFSAILALDVVYYDLEPARRREVEEILGRLVRENREESWINSSYALRGLWALFTGDRRAFERYTQLYIDAFYEALTEESVFNAGPGYALARFVNPDREQKHLFMDVLEFTGEGGFYGDPRIGRFYEWLLAHAMTPDGRSYTFGDTSPVASLLDGPAGAALYRAHRFSEAAGAYAAWWARQMRRPGSFVAYVLADRAPEPVRPEVSLIAADGGAWFVHTGEAGARVGSPGGQASSPGGSGGSRHEWIAGGLWNPRSSGGHAHKDVNAVHLAAYGEHLVVNSGYRGWGQGGFGFSWTYVHDEAISSNTVLIDGADHRLKHRSSACSGPATAAPVSHTRAAWRISRSRWIGKVHGATRGARFPRLGRSRRARWRRVQSELIRSRSGSWRWQPRPPSSAGEGMSSNSTLPPVALDLVLGRYARRAGGLRR